MNRKNCKAWILAVVAFLVVLSIGPAVMADQYAKITGTVTDPSGAAVVDAKLTATNVETNVSFDVTSGADGGFTFLQLPVGTYKVTITKEGFRSTTTSDIVLRVAQVYSLNPKLELGKVSETVVVEVSNLQVQTVNTQLGTTISGDTIVDMPLNGRNWVQLQQLQPGVVAASDRFGSNYSTNGSQSQQNSYLINGQDSNDLPLNTPLILPSPDAIGEFTMITNTINPEYGRNSGAILNAVIKSGTNSFHGDVFDFYRDTSLNTHDFFQKVPSVFHQHMFGGVIGGPIVKDHTFFFFSYQGTRARQAQSGGNTPVFSAAQRSGDFSAGAGSLLDVGAPFALYGDASSPCPVSGGVQCAAGTSYLTLFSTGVVPTQDFNSISANLMNTYVPQANSPSGNYVFSPVTKTTADQELFRIDHNFSTKDMISGYGFFQRNPSSDTLPFTGATLPGFGQHATRDQKQFTFTWNHTFSSTTLNELRLGYTRFNFAAVLPETPTLPSSVGFNITPQNPGQAGLPVIAVTGYFTLGFSSNGPQPRKDQTYQITDNFSFTRGKHNFKFGFEGRRFWVTNPFYYQNGGYFSFDASGPYSTGLASLDFLLGIPDSYAQSSGSVIDAKAQQFYSYAQDSYRIRPNLVMNYGLGWQVDTPITDMFNNGLAINCFRPSQQSHIYPTAPLGLVFPGDKGCSSAGYYSSLHHFAPRLGFAWSPDWGRITGGQGKFSIRAGVGVYANRSEEELTLQNLLSPPFSLIDAGVGDVGGTPSFADPWTDVTGSFGITDKYPFAPPPVGSTTVDFGFYQPFSLNVLDPRLTSPYAINYNLTVEREIPAQIILTVGYVGSSARHLIRAYELNPGINPLGCAADPGCIANRVVQGFYAPGNFQYDPTIFGSVGQQASDGNSHYNSLQVSAKKRLSHGLTFLASYTWSRSIDNGSSFENTSFGARGTNPFTEALNVGDSAFDARQRFVISYQYEIPMFHRLQGKWLDRALKGWRIAGNTTFQTGFPFNLSDTGFRSLTCWAWTFYGCPDNPNQVAPVTIMDPRSTTQHYYFDKTAFARQAYGTFGNAGRDSIHGPGINVTNLALLKDIKVDEKRTVELRLETFNTFNHASFANPSSNIASSQFGRITSVTQGARLIQLAAKFYF